MIDRLRAITEKRTRPGEWERSQLHGDTLTVYDSRSGGAIAWVNGDNWTGPHHPDADAAAIVAMDHTYEALLAVASECVELVRLGNQPGMDDDEMDAAYTAAEAALAALAKALEDVK